MRLLRKIEGRDVWLHLDSIKTERRLIMDSVIGDVTVGDHSGPTQ